MRSTTLVFIFFLYGACEPASPKESLAVIVLQTEAWTRTLNTTRPGNQRADWTYTRADELDCTLRKLERNVAVDTPLVVYIFDLHDLPQGFLHTFGRDLRMRVVENRINANDWNTTNSRALDEKSWSMRPFTLDYRLMGQWRLIFPFNFCRTQGHEYVLFVDTDSFVMERVGFNIVERMRSRHLNLGFRAILLEAWPCGLAELARYYIVSRSHTPTQLFDDCTPHSIEGVHGWWGAVNNGSGWKGSTPHGNFFLVSVDFWYSSQVQDFLGLVIATGDHIVHRWNEQATNAMIRLLFSRADQEVEFIFNYQHGKKPNNCV